jgi:soluble lytic murein transglycosylase-like protein
MINGVGVAYALESDGMGRQGTTQRQSLIVQAAERFALPERCLDAVMRTESGGCPEMNRAPTISSAGAMGLMHAEQTKA